MLLEKKKSELRRVLVDWSNFSIPKGMAKRLLAVSIFIFVSGLVLLLNHAPVAAQVQGEVPEKSESVTMVVNQRLEINSDQASLTKIFIIGNISAADFPRNEPYPLRSFYLQSQTATSFEVTLYFDYPTAYSVYSRILGSDGIVVASPFAYYISQGEFKLVLSATVQPSGGLAREVSVDAFVESIVSLSRSVPLWVKALYVVLAVQFGYVGYKWINYEEERRSLEWSRQPLDRGNKLYLWSNIVFRTLLTAFIILVLAMLGEIAIIVIARSIFLIDVVLLTATDFMVLFLAGTLTLLAYIGRFTLDRFFDLKPVMEE